MLGCWNGKSGKTESHDELVEKYGEEKAAWIEEKERRMKMKRVPQLKNRKR